MYIKENISHVVPEYIIGNQLLYIDFILRARLKNISKKSLKHCLHVSADKHCMLAKY